MSETAATVDRTGFNPASTPATVYGAGYRRYLAIVLLGVSTLNYLDRQIVNILAEPMKHELGLHDWQIGVIAGLSFAIFYSVLGLPIARLADRANRPIIIGTSLLIWSSFTFLCGAAGSFTQMLLARIGVGSGEAGGGPPCHSLISDFTTPQNRSSALAFYSLGSPLGSLFGLGLGAIVAEHFGWRAAFYFAAVPGILLGLLIFVTVREPRRQMAAAQAAKAQTTLSDAWAELRTKKTFWWICAGASATSFVTYGQGAFWGSYFLRQHGAEIAAFAHGMGPLAVVGLTLALVKGISGIVGTLTGGFITDRLTRRDLRSFCTVPAIALILAAPGSALVLLAPNFGFAAAALILPVFFSALIFGPSFASVQTLVSPGTRATAAAVLLFILTLAGLGLGPVCIGLMSDFLSHSFGTAGGLRWALMLTVPFNLLAGGCFWIARRTLVAELQLG